MAKKKLTEAERQAKLAKLEKTKRECDEALGYFTSIGVAKFGAAAMFKFAMEHQEDSAGWGVVCSG